MMSLDRGNAQVWRRYAPRAVALWAITLAIPGAIATAPAAGPSAFSAIFGGLGQDYASSLATDAQGNVYVAGLTYSSDFPVTPGAAQTQFGGTCDAFVSKFGPDGTLLWSTFLGGILDDWATGVAVDGAGNVWVTGWTRSANFPLVNPIQGTLDNGASDDYDAFVAKLDPTGSQLLYSTFLGGAADDGAAGIALDVAGNAYVAGTSQSETGFPGAQNAPNTFGIFVSKLNAQGALVYTFIHPYGSAGGIALDASGSAYVTGSVSSVNPSRATQTFGPPGNAYAIAFKISPDGSKKIYETALGGSVSAAGAAIAVDGSGAAYVAGSTSSVDFPLVQPIQNSLGARPLWKSTDSGVTWAPMDALPFALPQALVADPTAPNTLYAATTDLGIFKSLDGGVTWTAANNGIANATAQALAIDPVHPQTLYAVSAPAYAATASVYKTVDGATSWTLIDSPAGAVSQLPVDAQNPNIVWEVTSPLRKSTDGGATWNTVTFPGSVESMALDPRVSGNIFAISNLVFCGVFCTNNQNPYIYHSTDGGADWVQISSPTPVVPPGLTVDGSTNPSTIYDGLADRSVDGGVTWTPVTPPPGAISGSIAVAVDSSGKLYAAVYDNGIFVSSDHGQTWTAIGSPIQPFSSPLIGPAIAAILPAGTPGSTTSTVYAMVNQTGTSGFVTKLTPDGSSIVYSTYLRGHSSMEANVIYAAEPGAFETQNWISGIAVDAAGNAVVAGGTRSVDMPVAFPAQAANAGLADAFASTISADGSKLTYSTYLGGSQDDGALAVAVDSQGNVILAGQTRSYSDFPVSGPQQPKGGYGDAFVTRLPPPAAPVIASVVNAASLQPGIEAGSLVTILGSNLANTNTGQSWSASEIVNGILPTSLEGVSVTIDGKPAFVAYISPTQINVQAPSDATVGSVHVVVTNNGAVSAPATAQLQPAAPAFFQYPGTNYASASLLPGYAQVADPSAVPGAVAAKPGDIVVLWGTGFGATNPAVAAGTLVTGAPVVVTTPIVTVGGVAAPVISAVLTPGTAGLYQVTIQIPQAAPAGAVAVQASVGGLQTANGVTIFVGQ
jgi:uncharacterized protein (TIGR03437 family)